MPRPRGQIKRLKNGVWQMRVETNRNGRRRSTSKRYPTKQLAEAALKELLAAIREAEESRILPKTFNDLFDAYLEIVAPTVSRLTLQSYERHIRLHLRPRFGAKLIVDLEPFEVERFYAELQTRLAGETIAQIHNQLRASLQKARLWKWIASNPMEFVKPPSRATKPAQTIRKQQKKAILTPEEIERFIAACDGLPSRCFWLFFALTGARAGEVCAARWKDIDFNANTFNLRQNLIWPKGLPAFTKPKTAKSSRLIPLPSDFVALLKSLKAEQNVRRLQSLSWRPFDLIFDNGDGMPHRPSNIGRLMTIIAERAGLGRHVTPHLLRHSWASNALKEGINIKVVSDFLGHSSPSITLRIYSHITLEDKRGAVEVMGGLLRVK